MYVVAGFERSPRPRAQGIIGEAVYHDVQPNDLTQVGGISVNNGHYDTHMMPAADTAQDRSGDADEIRQSLTGDGSAKDNQSSSAAEVGEDSTMDEGYLDNGFHESGVELIDTISASSRSTGDDEATFQPNAFTDRLVDDTASIASTTSANSFRTYITIPFRLRSPSSLFKAGATRRTRDTRTRPPCPLCQKKVEGTVVRIREHVRMHL